MAVQNVMSNMFGSQGAMGALAALSQSAGKKVTSTDQMVFKPEDLAAVNKLLQSLVKSTGDKTYSKEAAISDSQGLVQSILKDQMQKFAPAIAEAQTGSGMYNASTSKLLSNDLQSRVAVDAAQAVQQNILNYAQARQGKIRSIADALSTAQSVATAGGRRKTVTEESPNLGFGQLAALSVATSLIPTIFNEIGKASADVPPVIQNLAPGLTNNYGDGTSDFAVGGSTGDVSVNFDVGSLLSSIGSLFGF